MIRIATWLLGVAAAFCALSSSAEAQLSLPGFTGARGDFAVPVTTLQSQRFESVIHQQRDFSCGAAALATLLRYHYAITVSETDVFSGMWEHGDQDRIRKLGFSLLEMKRYLAANGFMADGFTVDLDKIAKATTPGIALLTINGYKHFVVVKGVSAGRVLIGDPALGLRAVSRTRFLKEWNGVYFVIRPQPGRARPVFNDADQWNLMPRVAAGQLPSAADTWSLRVLARAPGEF